MDCDFEYEDDPGANILSSNRVWMNQQTSFDAEVVNHLTDKDLDALSFAEFLQTAAQSKVRLYPSRDLTQNKSPLGLGTGLDFDLNCCTLPGGHVVVAKRVKLLTPLLRQDGSSVSDLSRCTRIVLQEIRILKHAPVEACQTILGLEGASLEGVNGDYTTPFLLLEYADFGTLRHFLSQSLTSISLTEKAMLCLQVGSALMTLHDCQICHGDVKLDNVLVVRDQDGKAVAKVANFEHSIIVQPGDSTKTYRGTSVYNSPEVRSCQKSQASAEISTELLFACDIFAFGLLLYESIHNGLQYWKTHEARSLEAQKTLEIVSREDCQKAGCGNLDWNTFHSLQAAIFLSIDSEPERRRSLKSILQEIPGYNDNSDSTNLEPITLLPKRPIDLIDLADPPTLFTLLYGGGHYTSQKLATRPPLSVQKTIFSTYERNTLSSNRIFEAFINLQLAICYFVGFGVDRDIGEAHKHFEEAAISQYPSLRLLLERLRQAFGPYSPDSRFLGSFPDPMTTQNMSILSAALQKPLYTSPLHAIIQTWNQTHDPDEIYVGPDLHRGAYAGEVDKVSLLIQQDQRDCANEFGYTAFNLACIDGRLPMVRLLLGSGSDIQIKDPDGFTAWHMLVVFPVEDVAPTAALFRKHDGGLDLINSYSSTPFPLPEMFDNLVGTPLHWAIQANNLTVVEALLKAGAKVTEQYAGILSPIELAASLRLHSILHLLLNNADLMSYNLGLETPFFSMNECHPLRLVFLHGGDLRKSTETTIEVLVKHFDINQLNSVGWTPTLRLCLTAYSEIDQDLVLAMLRWAKPYVEVVSGELKAISTIWDNASNAPRGLLERVIGLATSQGQPQPEDVPRRSVSVI